MNLFSRELISYALYKNTKWWSRQVKFHFCSILWHNYTWNVKLSSHMKFRAFMCHSN